eukprot:sb/3473593/
MGLANFPPPNNNNNTRFTNPYEMLFRNPRNSYFDDRPGGKRKRKRGDQGAAEAMEVDSDQGVFDFNSQQQGTQQYTKATSGPFRPILPKPPPSAKPPAVLVFDVEEEEDPFESARNVKTPQNFTAPPSAWRDKPPPPQQQPVVLLSDSD